MRNSLPCRNRTSILRIGISLGATDTQLVPRQLTSEKTVASHLECDRCATQVTHLGQPAVYGLEGVEFVCKPLTVHTHAVWCTPCATLCDAEHLMGAEYYRRQLAELEANGLTPSDRELVAATKRDETAYLTSLTAAWRIARCMAEQRESPPRCLSCGSTDIRPIAEYDYDSRDISPFRHPECGGTFHSIECSYPQFNLLWLDSEGRQLNGESTGT